MPKSLLIALIAFRNEELFLPIFMKSLVDIPDLIIGYDDGSTDASAQIFESYGGILVGRDNDGLDNHGHGATCEIREFLLAKGREFGGTHFIVLDADEFFSGHVKNVIRKRILELKPGQQLLCNWVMATAEGEHYLNDGSVWKPSLKDFAFADSPVAEYPKVPFVHFARTPIHGLSSNDDRVISDDIVVIHLQFLNWRLGQIKQCWYRLKEILEMKKNYAKVNNSYAFTREFPLPEYHAKFSQNILEHFDVALFQKIVSFDITKSWYFKDIVRMLKNNKRSKVQNLDIWFLQEMKSLYIEIYGKRHNESKLLNVLNRNKLRLFHIFYLLKTFQEK